MKTRGISFLLALVLTVSSFWLPASGTEVVWAKEEQTQEEIQEEKQTEEGGVVTEAPSVMLMEVSTGTILFQKNAQEQRSPASITKIMTLLLIFEELEKGTLTMEEEVVTSAYAKSMGGSQVFLEEGEKQTVETMIKCIVVASGNDASVAMAEHIAGSEAEFVKRMNQRARELGMVHTNFEDCCGLTESAEHYTTAEDVALVSRELLRRFPKILEYSSIWMENITHVTRQGSKEFCLTNTNKLVRSYDGCVGLKTGSTSVAKFCVSAVAKRGDLMLLAVVMGAPDPKVRFKDAAALLDYGFGNCALYTDENKDSLKPVSVSRGAKKEAACRYKGAFHYLDTKGRNLEKVEKEILYEKNLKAPVKKGSVVGKAVYTLDGEEIGQMEIVSAENIRKAGFTDYLKKVAGKLLGMKA
ncbi:MAG: D-alanyl-D-alanine carboxypeptidase [Firmicutes bacterium]|nr:D-alanyl-D-alanine carboxypeptidase [Bacillota bacterium]